MSSVTAPKTSRSNRGSKSSNLKSRSTSVYSVHPGVAMTQKWVGELREKTGRSLEEWIRLVRKEGPPSEQARREWLKDQHGLGTNSAWWIAGRVQGKGSEDDDPEEYLRSAERHVEAMFAGAKAAMRPIYDKLLALGLGIGPDAKACPCQTIVPLYRNHVFAQIKPTTRTRIDLGFALGPLMKEKKKIPARLLDTGGFAKKDRITHRIPITAIKDIDDEVKRMLRTAYELDNK